MTEGLQDLLAAACMRHGIVGAQLAWCSLTGDSAAATFGLAHTTTGDKVTQRTRFQIGSVTKAMLACCVHHLAQAGAADLDQPLAYITGLTWAHSNPAFAAITPRHLMAHTSGLEGDLFEETGTDEAAALRLAEQFAVLAAIHALGNDVSYCNFGYVLLGLLIERWSGVPWHACVGDHIAQLIGANTLAFWPFPQPDHVAAGHAADGPVRRTHLALSNAAAGTSAIGTAHDLARFGMALLQLAESGDPVWQAMTTMPRIMARNERCIGFGEGLMVMDWDGQAVFGHDGLTIGQQAFMRIFPKTGVAYALLSNGGDMTGLHNCVGDSPRAVDRRSAAPNLCMEPTIAEPNPRPRGLIGAMPVWC